MATVLNKFRPFLKIKSIKLENWGVNWESLKTVMDGFGYSFVILTCLCPFFMIVPAMAFELMDGSFFIIGYFLSFILLIPWLVIPTLFIKHITSHSRTGNIISFIFLAILLVSYILGILTLNF